MVDTPRLILLIVFFVSLAAMIFMSSWVIANANGCDEKSKQTRTLLIGTTAFLIVVAIVCAGIYGYSLVWGTKKKKVSSGVAPAGAKPAKPAKARSPSPAGARSPSPARRTPSPARRRP
jgi:hypothetical protein